MGSEMCIRDSLKRFSSTGPGGLRHGGLASGEKAFGVPYRCLRTCLLYTSDAADDLLCVDLGGRRIIKKKKPENRVNGWTDTTTNNQSRREYTTVVSDKNIDDTINKNMR